MNKLSKFEKWIGPRFSLNNLVDASALEGWKAALEWILQHAKIDKVLRNDRQYNVLSAINLITEELEKLKGNIDEKD